MRTRITPNTNTFYVVIGIQKISSVHKFILQIQQILGSHKLKGRGRFWPHPSKNHQHLAFLNFNSMKKKKKKFIQSVHFWDTINFRVPWLDLPNSILTLHTQKFSDQLLIFVSLYQHAKNQFNPSLHSSDKVNVRVPSPDSSQPFLTMSTPKLFSHL